jgi:cobalt/nickel transport system permease protein
LHSHAFDRYHEKESFIHHLDPRVKVLITIIFIVSNALLPDGAWLAFVSAWLFLLAVNSLSRLGIFYTLTRSLIALPFALIAVTILFSMPGRPVFSFNIFMLNFAITDMGLLRFVSILIRSWLSVQMAILLVTVTRFPDLIHALEHLHVPAILTTIIAFLYRYLFVLTDEVLRLLRARESRSAAATGHRAGGGVLWRARVAGNMAGQLFLRSYERSDRIYNAMVARGYSGHLYTLNAHEMKSSDYYVTAFAIAIIFILQVIGRV